MKKVLFFVPHLSTGGMPQYTYDLMRKLKNEVDVYCVEYQMSSPHFVVQRNRIMELLGDKFFELGENKEKVFDIINQINPDIIHLQEMPEYWLPNELSDKLYSEDRNYLIVETSHDSSFYASGKRYYPDHFALISEYQRNEFSKLNIPIDLVEADIEYKPRVDREMGLRNLGLDPNIKHVLTVGLFTPRKNQAEVIEYARKLQGHPIQFHFVGNQADNFRDYWEPLMRNLPSNVKIWGERSDVNNFYSCMDLMLFTSRGTGNDKETSPLVIREAIGYNLPSLIYNLPVYMGMYDKYETISYLDTISFDNNLQKIVEKLSLSEMNVSDSFCTVVSTYTNTKDVLDKTIRCIQSVKKNIGTPVICCNHYDDMFFNDSIKSVSDEYVLDTNNILTKNSFYKVYNESIQDYDIHLHLDRSNNDTYHGPAVYQNYYNGVRKAKELGYKYAVLTNFDMNFSDTDSLNVKRIMNLLSDKNLNGFFLFQNEQEGPTFKTVFCIVNTETFMEVFPEIKNESDYNSLVNRFGSETNNLENLFYHALKNVDKIMTEEKHESQFFTSNECFTNSQVDYFSILPIQDGKFGIYIKKSNDGNVNQRIKIVGTKNDVVFLSESFDVSNSFSKVIEVDLETNASYNFELIQTDEQTINRKTLSFNDLSSIRQNGHIKRRVEFSTNLNMSLDIEENKINITSNKTFDSESIVVIRDRLTGHVVYNMKVSFLENHSYWVIPCQNWFLRKNDYMKFFCGYVVDIYNTSYQLIDSYELVVEPGTKTIYLPKISHNPRNSSWGSFREIFFDGVYDHFDFNNVNVAIDVGANDGLFTDWLLSHGAKSVYMVEPDRRSADFLKKKYLGNSKTVVVDKALSNEDGKMEIYFSDDCTTTTSGIKNGESLNSVEVESISYKTLLSQNQIESVDLIKIDIEGMEYELIESIEQSLIDSVKYFIVEIHNVNKQSVGKLLKRFENFNIEIRDHGSDNTKVDFENMNDGSILTVFAKNKNNESSPKIRAVHMLLEDEPDASRQIKSIENVSLLTQYGVEYKQHLNKRFIDFPPKTTSLRPNDVTMEKRPYALNPSHFGCYNSMKNAVLSEFDSNVDYLMLFEGDAYIQNHEEFISEMNKVLPLLDKKNVGYISFGGKHHLQEGTVLSSKIEDLNESFFVCDKIIGCQCIVFPSWIREKLKNLILKEGWDVTDLYLNTIFNKHSIKMAVSDKTYVTQLDGTSMIDEIYKINRIF